MTLLKDRMTAAGLNTAESRLAVLAVSALQESNGSLGVAVETLWRKLSSESWVAKEVWLKPYLIDRQRDMRGVAAPHQAAVECAAAPPPTGSPPSGVTIRAPRRSPPDPERRENIARLVEKAVTVIRFKYQTSDGRDWAAVGAHELAGMDRDGALARALQARLGAVSNSQRFMTLGELMAPNVFDEVRSSLASASK